MAYGDSNVCGYSLVKKTSDTSFDGYEYSIGNVDEHPETSYYAFKSYEQWQIFN